MSEQYKCGLPYNKVDDTLVEDTSFKEETAFEFLASASYWSPGLLIR